MITQKELKKVLNYNQETGVFYWIGFRSGASREVAGFTEKNGYRRIMIDYKRYPAQRLAWFYIYGKWPKKVLDHINRDRDDNRISNLREVTDVENCRNKGKPINNTSGCVGVTWHILNKKWIAFIVIESKRIHLGYFSDFFEACCSRLSAQNKYNFHATHGRDVRQLTLMNTGNIA